MRLSWLSSQSKSHLNFPPVQSQSQYPIITVFMYPSRAFLIGAKITSMKEREREVECARGRESLIANALSLSELRKQAWAALLLLSSSSWSPCGRVHHVHQAVQTHHRHPDTRGAQRARARAEEEMQHYSPSILHCLLASPFPN